ncbi:hypothetical protein [Enterococcus sp. 2201sp1_2201st1_B8_2201SCRN_220225]|uniref:hypothetical protein n=1 Tax=unclassified Enterococcus TaxID=2608891 RepID=UPI0034A38CE4
MNNRHRRVAKLKAQEEKRLKAKVIAAYELANKFLDGFTEGIRVIWDAFVDIVDSISRGIDEALHK